MYDVRSVGSGGFCASRTKTVLWNSAVVPALGHLRALSSVTVPFKVQLKSTFPGGSLTSANSYVKAAARVETLNVPDTIPLDSLTATDDLVTRITTAATLDQRLIDPLPPRVDQTTVYTVRWTIVNSSNEIAPAKVTGILMPGVTWKANVRTSQAQPTYDPKTSTLTWNVGSVPPGVGGNFPTYELDFQISVTPSVNQVNSRVDLVRDTQLEGTDVFTKEKIILRSSDLTTSESVRP